MASLSLPTQAMHETRIRPIFPGALLVSLLLVVAFRLPYIDRAFNDEDVAQIAYSASRAVEGQLLYRDTVDHKPPLALTIFTVTFRLFGKEMAAVNAIAILWALATTVLVFLLTDVLFGRAAAGGAALFYAVFANTHTVNGTSPSYDFWMLPFMVAAVYCLVRGLQPPQERRGGGAYGRTGDKEDTSPPRPHAHTPTRGEWWWLAAGVCSGLAVTSKQHALFNFIAILNYLAFVAWRDRAQRKQLPQQLLLLGTGFVAAWVPFILYFWSQDAVGAFVSALSPQHNVSYLGTRTWVDAIFSARVQLIRQISRDTILWVFALAGLVHLLTRTTNHRTTNGSVVSGHVVSGQLLWLWAFWSFVGVSITKRFYDHYFLQVIPVFTVLAGYVWGLCFQGTDRQFFLRRVPRWALVAGIVAGFVWSARYFRVRQMLRRTHALVTQHQEPTELEQVGSFVRAHTTPEDRIYVWGWKPEVYYFADRKAPTKWWEFGIEFGMWNNIAAEFERNKPRFIVVNRELGGPPEFREFVQRNYRLEKRMAQFQIFRLHPSLVRDDG